MDQARNITFWGLILQPGKRYEQIVEKSFHVSMATLDMSGSSLAGGSNTQVMINIDGKEFILCHLSKKNSRQQALDLNFRGGDALALYVEGETPQQVHLTGYYIEIDDEDDMDDLDMSEMLEEEEEAPALVPSNKVSVKRKNESSPSNASQKKLKVQKSNGQKGESDESEEGDEDSDTEAEDQEEEEGFSDDEEDGDEGDEEGDEDEEDDDDEDDEEDDDLEEEVQIGEKKNAPIALKKEKSPPSTVVNRKGSTNAHGLEAGDTGSKKKNPAKGSEQSPATPAKQEKKSQQTPKSAKRTLAGGVMVEELALGNGPVAKRGRPVSVYYVGRLKQNNKQFDATTGGPGFKFKLGGKEVIKGWDIGVEGMKVGGKRRITCPPHMAYGARGSPPVIPPNSVLVFDVTLKNVH